MITPAGKILLYLDWRTQEVGVAASRSGDEQLAADCGLTDRSAEIWKATDEGKKQRQRMKALQLGINYGMGIRSLSRGLDRHPLIAAEVITRHQQRYATYWAWRTEMVEHAMMDRMMVSEFDGWPLHISTSPNRRTLYNFPMQSGGSEMLRLGTNMLCEADLVPIMLVHDGILLELDNEEQVEHAKEIMQNAGAKVCGGLMIGVDEDQKLIDGKRYRDKRPMAIKMWNVVMNVLRELGALTEAG